MGGRSKNLIITRSHHKSYCESQTTHTALFIPLLKICYNEDIFQEESFLAWWKSKESREGSDKRRDLRLKAQDVIRYILESEDDDDDESE